jgi:hypothetical protein
MPGANYILSKGFLATGGSVAYTAGELVKLATGSTLQPAQVVKTSSQGETLIGVVMEDLDAAKVATGKATVGVQIMGIAKVILGTAASVVLGSPLTTGTTAKAELAASGDRVFGINLTAGTLADGDIIDVLLTPDGRTV